MMKTKIILVKENTLENFCELPDSSPIPRIGELINVLSNRFRVIEIEWFPLNKDIFIYVNEVKSNKVKEDN